ncbi:MAG: hypothetical protein IAI49_07695, partial [Candidatus Eremiobacteraeota bacterium]|nr:hypothetical protein [Candidatus Eremiobacteraeota bacterium]
MTSVFLIVGVKGGAGATTLCVDLARAARRAKRNVTIVDADLTGRRHVAELLDGVRALNANRGGNIFSIARADEIEVVELVDKYDDRFALRRNEVDALANNITVGENHLVLIDAPRPFETQVHPFVARASRVLLVMEPDHLGSASSRTLIRDLARFGIPLGQMWLVVNQRQGRADIATRELEKILGIAVAAELPRKGDKRNERAIDALLKKMQDAPPESAFNNLTSAMWSDSSKLKGMPGNAAGSNGAASGNGASGVDTFAREALERRNRIRHEI